MESDQLITPTRPDSPLHKVLCCIMPASSGQSTSTFLRDTIECGLQKLITSLDDVTQQRANCKDLDYNFLKSVLQSQDLQNLMKVHDKVATPEHPVPRPVSSKGSSLRNKIMDELELLSYGRESNELLQILASPHIKALLCAHDQIASKEFLPCLPEIPYEVDEDDGLCVKVVQLVKSHNQPLGATIDMAESETNTVKVARVLHGGAADRSGLLEVGDEVKEVNGTSMTGQSLDDVLKILSNPTDTITLKLRPNTGERGINTDSVAKVRVCFDYNPHDDPYTPCKEASMGFKKGDVLHIVSKEDAWWWQARKDGDSTETRAGLIPSKLLAEKLKGNIGSKENNKENRNISDEKSNKFSPRMSKKPKKTRKYSENEFVYYPEVYYEDVEILQPSDEFHRPLVLVSPSSISLDKVIDNIADKNPDHFIKPRLCSNQPQPASKSCKIKHVTSQELEKTIRDKKIIESEEKGGYFYAITDEEVKSHIHNGKTCIMTCKLETIHNIRRSDIKPYIVLVKPNPQDKTKLSGIPRKITKQDTDSKIMEECIRIEVLYGHLIDTTICYDKEIVKLAQTITILADEVRTKPTWVPAQWVT